MEKAFIIIKMGIDMKEILLMVVQKEKEKNIIKMEIFTKVILKIEIQMG